MGFYICIGALIGIILSLIIFKIMTITKTFGIIETNIENGQTLFRFTYVRDPKDMIDHDYIIFKIRTNKELHSLKDIGDTDSQK